MTELEHTSTVQRSITRIPAKIGIRNRSLWFVEAPQIQTAQNMSRTYCLVWSKLKTCMDIGHWFISLRQQEHAFLGSALDFIQITWCTLLLCHHSQGAQVGSIRRTQLRPSDIVVSHDIWRLFQWFPDWIRLKICKIWLHDLTWKIWLFMTSKLSIDFIGVRFLS